MVYIGLSPRGTPLWINRLVAEADFKVVVGRIAPHNTHGYEGGAKMITPATSHWLTVLRNHSCNFSPYCEYGSYGENPSRADVDDIGGMVHLEYIVNFVVNRFGSPCGPSAGTACWPTGPGIAFGDREVWGAEIGQKADLTIATLGANLARGAHAPSPPGAGGDRHPGQVGGPRARPGHAGLHRPPSRGDGGGVGAQTSWLVPPQYPRPGSRRRLPGPSTRSSWSTSGATSSAPPPRSLTAASPSGEYYARRPGTSAMSSSPSTARRRRC